MSRRLGPALALGLALLAAAGCGGPNVSPLVVGHVANRGAADPAGRGMGLALADLKDQLADALGGRPLEIRHTDTRGQLDAFEAEAARLVAVNRAAALVGGTTPEEVARLERAQVPVLTFLGHAPAGLSNLTFHLGTKPEQQGEALGRYAAEELKLDNVVVLADDMRPESALAAEAFARAAGERAPKVVRFGKEPRWKDLAERAGKEKPRAVVFAGRASDFRELRAELTRPWPALIYAGDDGDLAALEAGKGAEGVIAATAFVADDRDSTLTPEFVKKYRDTYKTEPDARAALGYDAVRLLADALKRAHPETKAEALRDALARAQDLPGVTGPLTVTEDRRVRRPLHVVRVEAGAVMPLKRYPPGAAPR